MTDRIEDADGGGEPRVPRRSRWPRVLIGVVALMFIGVVVWTGARAAETLLRTKPALVRLVGNPLQVRAARVAEREITETIGGTTLAQPVVSTAVNVAVREGRVKRVGAELGKIVRNGDRLVEFDTTVYRETLERGKLQVEMAKSDLKKIEVETRIRVTQLKDTLASLRERVEYWRTAEETTATTLRRMQALYEQKVVALVEVEAARVKNDEAKSALATARLEIVKVENDLKTEPEVTRAQIDSARFKIALAEQEIAGAQNDMQNTTLLAPATGVISQRTIDPGEWVKSGKTAFLLDQLSPMYAVAEIEQEKASYVSVGHEAQVVFDSYPTETFRGKVAKIDPTIDPVKRTFKAFVLLDNPSFQLRPGMAAFTRLVTPGRRMMLVPRLAVINPTGSPSIDATVFVIEDDKAVARRVKLGKSEGVGQVEVLSGLKIGELVVIHGQYDVDPGDRVKVVQVIESPTGPVGRIPSPQKDQSAAR